MKFSIDNYFKFCFVFKELCSCQIEVIKGLNDKGQFQYLT